MERRTVALSAVLVILGLASVALGLGRYFPESAAYLAGAAFLAIGGWFGGYGYAKK
jgi:hypothetical protein